HLQEFMLITLFYQNSDPPTTCRFYSSAANNCYFPKNPQLDPPSRPYSCPDVQQTSQPVTLLNKTLVFCSLALKGLYLCTYGHSIRGSADNFAVKPLHL